MTEGAEGARSQHASFSSTTSSSAGKRKTNGGANLQSSDDFSVCESETGGQLSFQERCPQASRGSMDGFSNLTENFNDDPTEHGAEPLASPSSDNLWRV